MASKETTASDESNQQQEEIEEVPFKRYSFEIKQADIIKYLPDQKRSLFQANQNRQSPNKKTKPSRSITTDNVVQIKKSVASMKKRSSKMGQGQIKSNVERQQSKDEESSPSPPLLGNNLGGQFLDISPQQRSRQTSSDPKSQTPIKYEDSIPTQQSLNQKRKTKAVADKFSFNMRLLRDSSKGEEFQTKDRKYSYTQNDNPKQEQKLNQSALDSSSSYIHQQQADGLGFGNNTLQDILETSTIEVTQNAFDRTTTSMMKLRSILTNHNQSNSNINLPQVESMAQDVTNRRAAPAEDWSQLINGPRKRESSLKSYRNQNNQVIDRSQQQQQFQYYQQSFLQRSNVLFDSLNIGNNSQFINQPHHFQNDPRYQQKFQQWRESNLRNQQDQQKIANSRIPTNQSNRTQEPMIGSNFITNKSKMMNLLIDLIPDDILDVSITNQAQENTSNFGRNKTVITRTPIIQKSYHVDDIKQQNSYQPESSLSDLIQRQLNQQQNHSNIKSYNKAFTNQNKSSTKNHRQNITIQDSSLYYNPMMIIGNNKIGLSQKGQQQLLQKNKGISLRFDYEAKHVNSRVSLQPSKEITVLQSKKEHLPLKAEKSQLPYRIDSPDQEYQSDQINYEYVANENINESNILQSTKNKFKKSFVFQEDMNIIKSNRSAYTHQKLEVNNRISSMYQHQQQQNQQQYQMNQKLKNKNMTKSKEKQTEGVKYRTKILKLEENYQQLQNDFDSFRGTQEQITQDLKDQIQQLYKMMESCKCRDKNVTLREQVDPKKTEMSQRFEKVFTPFLSKNKSFKFTRNASPNTNNISFNIQNSNILNLRTFQNKDDKIYFQTSVVSSEKSILGGSAMQLKTDRGGKIIDKLSSHTKMFGMDKSSLGLVNNKCGTLNKQKNLVINISDGSQEREVLKEVKTPSVNQTLNQQTAKNIGTGGKKNLFEYNNNLSVKSQSLSQSRNRLETKYEPCQNYNPQTQSSFSKDVNMLSENVEEEHELLLANNNNKQTEYLLDCENSSTIVITQNRSQISLPKYKATMTQVMSPTRREFNSMDEIIREKINDKDCRDRVIAAEGFVKEKYLTAPQFFSSKNECFCQEYSDKCLNRYCRHSVSSQLQNQIVVEELNKLYINFKSHCKRPDVNSPLDLLRASINEQDSQFEDTERINNSRRDLDQSYVRPGMIKNFMALRPNLIEVFDYIAVPQAIWKYLYSWYSTDWSISRKLVQDSIAGSFIDKDIDSQNYDVLSQDEEEQHYNKRLTLDLYPYHC
ncbi:ubiquitin carboxyl-terminal hydrolase [Stylonychia lemnae]|uniref:Ubiquitin carboxyl-terminal hydrolase n=1 Tax=Stylonychia lemnae TaxID=5949 RepID=A0A078A795_STYLE|nr:ubiquitin carboxyl-terminal hydrolase [Stylonychia lemnae]|eukprot:CDW76666.1 ubiquitin carboxyl-terminal hydrolase [Stylonychia lemnae]